MKRIGLIIGAAGLLAASAPSFSGDVVVPTVRRVDEGVVNALKERRVSLSDSKKAYNFSPFACVRCHSGGPGATAPIFYGNPDFAKDQWKPSGTGVTIRNFKWEDVSEHDESFYKIGATQAELLKQSW
jgi:hypothetical protein